MFRAKQATEPDEVHDEDEDNGETEVKKAEKTPLEQLREIQDNIEFQYRMSVDSHCRFVSQFVRVCF